MKSNKKLKLNTKKVVILSKEQQNTLQGGATQTDYIICASLDNRCTNRNFN